MENTAATRVSARLGFEASDPVLMETQRHRASEGMGVHAALIDCDLEGEGYQRRVHFSAEPDQIWFADEEEDDDEDAGGVQVYTECYIVSCLALAVGFLWYVAVCAAMEGKPWIPGL